MFENISDVELKIANLEHDLLACEFMRQKVRNSEAYAQNLYAALCNNEFLCINDSMGFGTPWTCSWRYAGGIVAQMQGYGDYTNWYCSGIRGDDMQTLGYVGESIVTDEIRADLATIDWRIQD